MHDPCIVWRVNKLDDLLRLILPPSGFSWWGWGLSWAGVHCRAKEGRVRRSRMKLWTSAQPFSQISPTSAPAAILSLGKFDFSVNHHPNKGTNTEDYLNFLVNKRQPKLRCNYQPGISAFPVELFKPNPGNPSRLFSFYTKIHYS